MEKNYPCQSIFFICICLSVFFSGQINNVLAGEMKKVTGDGCFIFGDDDTPASAKKRAYLIAKRNAVENYKLYVVTSSKIRNFELKEDEAATLAEGMLYETKVLEATEKNREICVKIEAYVKPGEIDKLLKERMRKQSKPEGILLTGDWQAYSQKPSKSESKREGDTIVWSYSVPETQGDTFAGINMYLLAPVSVKDKKMSIAFDSEEGHPVNVLFFSFVQGYSKEDEDETYVPADCPVRLKPGKQEVLLDPSLCTIPEWWRDENNPPKDIVLNPELLRYIDFNAVVDEELGPVSDIVKIGAIRIH